MVNILFNIVLLVFAINNQHQQQLMKQYRHSENMVMTTKQTYSICEKLFCLRCLHCLQNQVILTTDQRRQILQKMIRNFTIDQNEDNVQDSIKLMILIHLCLDETVPQRFISRCQINPDHSTESYRKDMQFYIPQLCNYLVFHNDLQHNYLSDAVEKASKLSFYFAHSFYFYMNSLQKIIGQQDIQIFKKVTHYKDKFLQDMSRVYQGQMLNSIEFYLGQRTKTVASRPSIGQTINMYGYKQHLVQQIETIMPSDVPLPNYCSVYFGFEVQEPFSFKSTINFFQDLFSASQELKTQEDKYAKLHQSLRQINQKLPACVYVPFVKDYDQYYNVLNIVVNQTIIFSTKERNPFYICLEVFDPIQCCNNTQKENYLAKRLKPITLKRNSSSESAIQKPSQIIRQRKPSAQISPGADVQTQVFSAKDSHYLTNKLLEYSNQMQTQPRLFRKSQREVQLNKMNTKEVVQKLNQMFGETQQEMRDRIKQKSIYGGFSTWKLIHLMIKTSDNLKQEQFALQLIYQFDYIFKLQNLPLILTPYQVLSMGPDYGVIEMVKQAVSFDKLKKTLKNDFGKQLSLKDFFQIYFGDKLMQAKDVFMKSLAAYSIVMYFLQVKDRHNGNILIHRSGKILHIDFGFLLSNMPGKGVQLQKDCPFKLLSQYIQVLDGPQSYYFKKFRQYLFLGFKAARKHQDKIMMLVKMMYSSNGMTMPCFEKGQQAIQQLQLRFNPPKVTNDAQLNLHCQKLINNSLDNWATKWYDRFQYFAQGILY